MRAVTITYIFVVLVNIECFSQEKPKQEYYDMFGERIEFFRDSTFKFTWNFDLSGSWTIGSWQLLNDTIFLKPILIMDTLTIRDSNNNLLRDSLVLSPDQNVDRIEMLEYTMGLISGGGQNRRQPPNKLFLKKEKLFRILDNGNLDKSRSKAFLKKKKYKTYFKLVEQ